MNVLIVGSGGREHALAWKLNQSAKVTKIFVAPGNAGTHTVAQNLPLSGKKEILEWLAKNPTDLVVVGPDSYLAEGIVDDLREMEIPVFGPTKAAAEIEWSKAFAKDLMKKEGIPTAAYEVFTDISPAKVYLQTQSFPVVIKASGLALGKGVIIANSLTEAMAALDQIMTDKAFGEAGNEVIIEEYLVGREISVHVFCDGEHTKLFPSSQDHKRIFDNDQGPNTGGMGTIAPVPWVTAEHMKSIENLIVIPILNALKKQGRPFTGILFPGVFITENGPKVIEFNARFGDPETQSYMRLLESDLFEVLFACTNGTLDKETVNWSGQSACCVIATSAGYPGTYEKGKTISGIESIPDKQVVVFHAGTEIRNDEVVTSGGRVLGISAIGNGPSGALAKAYAAFGNISFEGMFYRKDIGRKSLE